MYPQNHPDENFPNGQNPNQFPNQNNSSPNNVVNIYNPQNANSTPNPYYSGEFIQPYPNNPYYPNNFDPNFSQGFNQTEVVDDPKIEQASYDKYQQKRQPWTVKQFKRLVYGLLGFSLVLILVAGWFYYRTIQLEQSFEQQLAFERKIIDDEISRQQAQKNEITDIFEDQAAINDDLIAQQKEVVDSANEYVGFIDRNIRYIDSKPQIFGDFEETEALAIKNELVKNITDLDFLTNKNTEAKDNNVRRIEQIYIEAEEDRNNTANDREGFR